MDTDDTTTQEAYNQYITETAKKVTSAVNIDETQDDEEAELEISNEIREQINNSDWYSTPLDTIQFAKADPTNPKYTPRWAELAAGEDIRWDVALEEAVYICLFNDVMTKVKNRLQEQN